MSTIEWIAREARRLGLPLAEHEVDDIAVRVERVRSALREVRSKHPACPEPPYTFVVDKAAPTE